MQNPQHPDASNPDSDTDASEFDPTNYLLEQIGTRAFVTSGKEGELIECDTSLLRDAAAWR